MTATEQHAGSLARLERRLQKLEDQNAQLADRNAKLTDQNARLSLRLETVVKDFDRLKEKASGPVPRSDDARARLPEPLLAETRSRPDAVSPFSLDAVLFRESPEEGGRGVGADSMS